MASDKPAYTVEIDERVHKDIRKLKLPANLIRLMQKHLKELEADPKRGAKQMRGARPSVYRVEFAGDLRVMYGISSKLRLIKVLAVRWRRTDSYDDVQMLAARLGEDFD